MIVKGFFFLKETVRALNKLQSNAAALRNATKFNNTTLEDTKKYLKR